MRRHAIAALGTAVALLGSLLSVSAPAAGAPTYTPSAIEKYMINTRHGGIYAEVVRPLNGNKTVKAPAILTLSPYSALGRGDNRDLVPKGYVAVFADVVGTGNSGGCYDYGGKRERQSGYDIVEWIAKQKWSNGKVAMTGGSYNGTTAWAAAIEKPPHLTTIVPEAAIVRWYDYAYSGGIRYFLNNESPSDEGVDTPFAFDFGFAVPPPLYTEGQGWAEEFQSAMTPCDEVDHTQHGYDDTPDYDKFWVERDYLQKIDELTIPVLVAHNWGDWNVKQEEAWLGFNALKNAKQRVLYMGTRLAGHGTPGGDYEMFKQAWFDHYLKGIDNGVDKAPEYVSQSAHFPGTSLDFTSSNNAFGAKPVTLTAQVTASTSAGDVPAKLLPQAPQKGPDSAPVSFPSTNINTELHMNHHTSSNHDWYYFQSPPLKRDVRLFGSPKVTIRFQIDREWVTLTPTIVDIDPACHQPVANVGHVAQPECVPEALYSVTRGWLDTRYRNGLAKQALLEPNKPTSVTVVQKPTDYTFKKGHHIGLQIATEINEWSIPKPYGCASLECVLFQIHWAEGDTKVTLPIVDAPRNPMDLFDKHSGH